MSVHAADRFGGGRWVVRRRWAPHFGDDTAWSRFRRRYRQVFDRTSEFDPTDALEFGEGLVAGIVIAIVVLVFVVLILPALVALIELALLLVLVLLGIGARLVFRRPWVVEAVNSHGSTLRWHVVGWRASTEAAVTIRDSLEAGVIPPDAEVYRVRGARPSGLHPP